MKLMSWKARRDARQSAYDRKRQERHNNNRSAMEKLVPERPSGTTTATTLPTRASVGDGEGANAMSSTSSGPTAIRRDAGIEAEEGPGQGEGHTTGSQTGSPKKKKVKKGAEDPRAKVRHHKRGGSGNDGDLRKYLS